MPPVFKHLAAPLKERKFNATGKQISLFCFRDRPTADDLEPLSVCLYACLSVCIYLCVSVCLFVCMSTCMSVCLTVYICLCVYLLISLFVLSVCLLVCLSVCLSVECPCACFSVYRSIKMSLSFLLKASQYRAGSSTKSNSSTYNKLIRSNIMLWIIMIPFHALEVQYGISRLRLSSMCLCACERLRVY